MTISKDIYEKYKTFNEAEPDLMDLLFLINPAHPRHLSIKAAGELLGLSESETRMLWQKFQRQYPEYYKKFKDFQRREKIPYQGTLFRPNLIGDCDISEDDIQEKF